MKCMKRNQTKFYFAPFDHKESILNEQGRPSGQHRLVYSKIQMAEGNVSSNYGKAYIAPFGKELEYDRTIVMDEVPFDEYAILWLNSEPKKNKDGYPELDNDGNMITPPDHIVKKIAESLNSVIVAVSKVNNRG